jgi:hypothetical protein
MSSNRVSITFDEFLFAYENGKARAGEHTYKGGALKGLEDFVNRVPFLLSEKLTQCETVAPKGYEYVQDNLGRMGNELTDCIRYMDFRIYVAQTSPKRGIRTRLEKPLEIEDSRKEWIKNVLSVFVKRAGEEISASKKYKDKFEIGEVVDFSGSTAISSYLINQEETMKGRIWDYWKSYWAMAMKPVIATVIKYSQKSQNLLENSPIFFAPE